MEEDPNREDVNNNMDCSVNISFTMQRYCVSTNYLGLPHTVVWMILWKFHPNIWDNKLLMTTAGWKDVPCWFFDDAGYKRDKEQRRGHSIWHLKVMAIFEYMIVYYSAHTVVPFVES
jgi:hypothetical protein